MVVLDGRILVRGGGWGVGRSRQSMISDTFVMKTKFVKPRSRVRKAVWPFEFGNSSVSQRVWKVVLDGENLS